MATVTAATMHQDHRCWLGDNDMWRCDVSAWQEEQRQALADLAAVDAALKEHARSLQTHAAAVRLREQELRGHEHALAQFEQGAAEPELIVLAKAHTEGAARHAEQRQTHERLKHEHHAAMALVARLREAVSQLG